MAALPARAFTPGLKAGALARIPVASPRDARPAVHPLVDCRVSLCGQWVDRVCSSVYRVQKPTVVVSVEVYPTGVAGQVLYQVVTTGVELSNRETQFILQAAADGLNEQVTPDEQP